MSYRYLGAVLGTALSFCPSTADSQGRATDPERELAQMTREADADEANSRRLHPATVAILGHVTARGSGNCP